MAQLSFNECGRCNKGNGEFYCRVCVKFLCPECKQLHNIFLDSKHVVIDVNKEGRYACKPIEVCETHKKDYAYYCKNKECDCLICGDCTISVHRGHNCCDFKKIVDERRQNVIEIIKTIKTKEQVLKVSLKNIETVILPQIQTDKDDFDKKINAVTNELQCVIDSVNKIYATTASDFQSTETEKLTKVRQNVERVQNEYKDVLLKFEHILQEQHGVSFLFQQKANLIELENMDEIPNIPTADRISNFSPDCFIDQIVDELQNKFNIRSLREKTEEIKKLTESQADVQRHIKQLELKIATLNNEKTAELAKFNDTLQQEKTQFAKIEKSYESSLREKTEEIKKFTESQADLQRHMKQLELKIATLNNEKTAELAKFNDTLQQEKTQFAKIEKSYERSLREKAEEIKKLTESQTDSQRHTKQLELKIDTLNDVKTAALAKFNVTLQEEKMQFAKTEKNYESLLREKTEEINSLTDSQADLQRHMKQLELKIATLNNEKIQFDKIKKSYESSLRDKNDEIEALTKSKAETQRHMKQLEHSIIALDTERDRLAEFNAILKHEKMLFARKENNYKSLLREKTEEIKNLKESQAETERHMKQLEFRIATVTKEKTPELAKFNDTFQQGRTQFSKGEQRNERLINTPHLGNSIFVVGIDFGTTYSGYAFASKQDFASDPQKFSTSSWQGSKLLSIKAPTAVLLEPNQTLKSFGYEAENNYADLVCDDDNEGHFYFHQFKTLLHNEMIMGKRVTRTTEIKDMTGKPMQAIKVFSLAIGFLKDHLVERIKERVQGYMLRDDDLYFVLTVPATWNETAKQFMRDAAEMAGIKKEKIEIALEPLAASIFCQNLRMDRAKDLTDFSETVKSGMKIMVIDLGGETAGITVYQRQINGTIKEVIPPSGGPWGGKSIDDAFSNFMANICGPKVMEKLKSSELEDYIDLFREFETKKRCIKTDQTSKVVITLPVSLTDLVKKQHGKFETAVENCRYKLSVSYAKQKLNISPDAFRDLFKSTIDNLTKHLGKILTDPKLSDLNTILMVGGFSECELLQNAVRQKIGGKIKLLIPEEAGLAVLKGAVLYGFQQKVVSE